MISLHRSSVSWRRESRIRCTREAIKWRAGPTPDDYVAFYDQVKVRYLSGLGGAALARYSPPATNGVSELPISHSVKDA